MVRSPETSRADEESPASKPAAERSVRTRERERRTVRWLLLDGDRTVVVVALSVVIFGLFLGLGLADVFGVVGAAAVSGAFTAGITGVFALVTITVSINQLVLSRIVGSPGTIRERIESVHRFRGDVESASEQLEVSPTDPARFLEIVTAALRTHALEVRRTYGERHDRRSREEIAALVETLLELAEHVETHIETETSELYRILSPILNNSYSSHINTLFRIRETVDSLDEAEREALSALTETLELINVTRHYFKTLYIHEELATVSRRILVTGIPAAAVSFGVILVYGRRVSPPLPEPVLLVVVSGAIAVVFVPLSILFAYGIRLATVAKRTTTFGTFTPDEEMP